MSPRSIIVTALLALAACHPVDEHLGSTDGGPPPDAGPPPRTPTFGNARWAIHLGGVNDDQTDALGLDSHDDVIVSGSIAGAWDATMQYLPYTGFLTKRSAADGHEIWTVNLANTDPTGTSWVTALAIDTDDSVVVLGTHARGSVDLGGQILACTEDCAQQFVARYDAGGHLVWAHGFAPDFMGGGFGGLALAPDGSVRVVGGFDGTFDVGGGAHTTTSSWGVLLALDAGGGFEWEQIFDGGSFYGADAAAVAVTADGDAVVAGEFDGDVTIGGQSWHTDQDEERGFVAAFTHDGTFRWATQMDSAPNRTLYTTRVAIAPSGDVVLFGGEGTQVSGQRDLVTLRAFAPGGSAEWSTMYENADAGGFAVRRDGTMLTGGTVAWFQADVGTGPLASNGTSVADCMYLAAYRNDGRPDDAVVYPWTGVTADSVVGLGAMKDGGIAAAGHFGQTVDFAGTILTSNGDSDVVIFVIDPP